MPYRVDLRNATDDALNRLVELGAIDAERSDDGGIAALMPEQRRAGARGKRTGRGWV